MNGSSAFSNLLPTAAAQPAAQSSGSRKWEPDTAKVEFKKALDSARTEQDVKPKERPAKKIAADKDTKAPSENGECAARRGAKAEKPQVAHAEKAEPSRSKAEEESDTDTGTETTLMAAVEVKPEAAAVLPSLSLSLEPATDTAIDEGELTTAGALELNLDAEPQAAVLTDLTEPQVADVDAADLSATAGALANTATSDTSSADGAVAAETAIGTAVPLKNIAPTSANAELQPDAESSSDDSQSAVANDPKALFEKMLQAMTGSAGNSTSADAGQGEGQPQDKTAAVASAAVTTAPSALESLTRGLEQPSPASRGFVVQTAVPVALGQPNWSHAVGEKVLWLAAQNVQSAEIRLDPPELGPMQVKVSIQQEQATVSFTSQHAGVREALDQSLGRLRDMFNEQGLNLVNVDVSDRSFQRQQGEGESQRQGGSGRQQDDEEEVVAVSNIVQQRLVDHYA